MSLADDIRTVRDRTLAELTAAHDYYADSRQAWESVRRLIQAGQLSAYSNPVTGTTTTPADLLGRIPGYTGVALNGATFQSFLATFEAFFADLVRAWLRAYPHALADKADVPVDVVLDAPDKPAIVDFLIDRAVGGLFYRRPADWFAFLEKRLKLAAPPAAEVERLAEAKATRDVLVHNRGVVNETYLAKAGPLARYALGEYLDVPDPYHQEVYDLLLKVVADLSAAFLARFP